MTSADPDAGLRSWLRALSKDHPRRGFRNAYHDARGEGWSVNHKKIQRLWRDEGLRVPQRRRRKRLGTSTTPNLPVADATNRVWAVDFQFDATTDGRPVKIASIVDEHTRKCLGGLVERNITGDDLIDELDRLAAHRGYPAVLRGDNGPELACVAMAEWAHERDGLHFIPPGEPWRNGYVESFNSRIRDKCPNINIFWSLTQVRVVITDWKQDYNHRRRHSSSGYQAQAVYAATSFRSLGSVQGVCMYGILGIMLFPSGETKTNVVQVGVAGMVMVQVNMCPDTSVSTSVQLPPEGTLPSVMVTVRLSAHVS